MADICHPVGLPSQDLTHVNRGSPPVQLTRKVEGALLLQFSEYDNTQISCWPPTKGCHLLHLGRHSAFNRAQLHH